MGRDGSTGAAPRLPEQHWELTAPESYVLRQAARALPETTARFAVLELVAREALRLGRARVRTGLRTRSKPAARRPGRHR